MTCQETQQAIDARLTGTLGREAAAALDEHLATCASCRAQFEDALRLQAELRLLGTEGPSPRTWDRVAARLSADREFEQAAARALAATPASRRFDWRWMGLAAMLLLVIGSSLFVLRQSLGPATAPRPTPVVAGANGGSAATGDDDLVSTIEGELDLAAKHYENAIAGLERVASESETPIDPAVMATVRNNLEIIDQAIDDSRQALRTDPQSQIAQESLFDAFRRKVALLQDTIALMNDLRRTAPSRAVASGLNKG